MPLRCRSGWSLGLAFVAGPLLWALLLAWGWHVQLRPWLGLGPWALLQKLLLYPVLEEIVFRGQLQPWLHARLSRHTGHAAAAWWAISSQAILFGLAHVPSQGWQGLSVLVPGWVLGVLFWQTQRLHWCMLVHAWYNLGWLLLVR